MPNVFELTDIIISVYTTYSSYADIQLFQIFSFAFTYKKQNVKDVKNKNKNEGAYVRIYILYIYIKYYMDEW